MDIAVLCIRVIDRFFRGTSVNEVMIFCTSYNVYHNLTRHLGTNISPQTKLCLTCYTACVISGLVGRKKYLHVTLVLVKYLYIVTFL